MPPSSTALAAAGRALANTRDDVVNEWAGWVTSRWASSLQQQTTLRRQLGLLIDILIALTGSLRRPAVMLWHGASEWYGRTAADRGLATGEIVEEFQHLRELLIHRLSELIAAMPARQSMATVLRLNRHLDQAIAHAVVGYTDGLVETLLNRQGIPVSAASAVEAEIDRRIEQFDAELRAIQLRATGS